MKPIQLMLALYLATTLLACTPGAGEPTPTAESPAIRGTITAINAMPEEDRLGSITVEGEIQEDTLYDAAVVTVGPEAVIHDGQANGEVAAFADLAVGQTVEIYFDGPVAESYPVQARAGEIVILEP